MDKDKQPLTDKPNNPRKAGIKKSNNSPKKTPRPTTKQKKYLKELQNNALTKGTKTKGEMMQDCGYSPATSLNPANIESTPTFQKLLEKFLPDQSLLEGHKEGLTATKTIIDKHGDITVEPDYTNRHRYLETAYKLKGKIRGGEGDTQNLTQINITWGDGTK